MNPAGLIPSIAALVGEGNVLTGDAAMPYCSDWRARFSGIALAVVLPETTGQVAAVVALCAEKNVSIVPQGGNTGLSGGSVPLPECPQIVLNLTRMNRIRSLDKANSTITVEAGCLLSRVREAAEQAERLFPLGLTAIESRCEIGGNLSTNAGGIHVLRYGNMRDMTLGLEVVLPDGRIWDGLRSLRKDNSGYDLKHLFIGAEGTLGIITAAVLKLFPPPRSLASACVAVPDPDTAVSLLVHLRAACGDRLSAFELVSRACLDMVFKHIPDTREPFSSPHPWMVLIELTDTLLLPLEAMLADALRSFGPGMIESGIVKGRAEAEPWWKLRKNISEAQKREGISIKHDVAVPVSRVPAFIAQAGAALQAAFPGVRIIAFGHLGDGNIHYNVSMPETDRNRVFIEQHEHETNRMVYDIVSGLGGSISAEHGLGQLKRDEIKRHKSGLEMELMRTLKHALDPAGRMNPGKVV